MNTGLSRLTYGYYGINQMKQFIKASYLKRHHHHNNSMLDAEIVIGVVK
jgi:hypothetical protein